MEFLLMEKWRAQVSSSGSDALINSGRHGHVGFERRSEQNFIQVLRDKQRAAERAAQI
jgi:hypothetical protein